MKRKKSNIIDSENEEENSPPKKKAAISASKSSAKPRPLVTKVKSKKAAEDDDYDMESPPDDNEDDDSESAEDEDDFDIKPKSRKALASKSSTKKAPAASTSKSKAGKEETATPSKKSTDDPKGQLKGPAKKFDWAAKKAAQLAGPVAHGSKAVPAGALDALAGLSMVFTGELSSFSREEAIDLAKRFGARVVLQPSSKTDFVVLGDNAGPSKIAAIKKHGIKTLSEDEFLNLIGTRKGLGNGKMDEKTKKKMEKEQEEIKKAAKEMEKRERTDRAAAQSGKAIDPKMQLWTVRYAPQNLKEICGNKSQVEKLQTWLHDWSSSLKSGFKKPGKSGMNVYRAVLITGPPGIGKTTAAHLCAKLEGFTPIELNASDARSKKLVENGMNINNTSLDGFLKGPSELNSMGVAITDKSCLIMDEVDGMSAGDRGGVGALNALIKKSKIPIICIANDRQAQKLKPLMGTTFNLPFQRPQAQSIRSRILSIAFKEKLKIPANVIDQLITGAQSDIRQVVNMLSTWKLSNDTMDFDEGKALAKMNQKYSILSPFEITSKLLGPYVYSATSRETLNDKMDYYFQDHSFVPLFIQENYLKTQPSRLRNLEGPEKVMKELQLMDRAASSISDGDLVDALIHGPEQHWGLMPLHAICSTVTPTSLLYGSGSSYGGPNAMTFPQWLGQNSKQGKLGRQLGDVQIRMRLKVSGDKSEIRQSYIPALFPHIIKPLIDEGASAVDDVIGHMDEYYLSKEDWDTIVELGVDEKRDDAVLKKIPTATKTALTRKYNSTDHPIPFHKAQDLGKAPKKLAGGPAPDLEEAYVDDVIEDASDDDTKKDDTDDVAKDSLIKAPKPKKKAAPAKKREKSG
ncbi:replication factor RFC1 C terminal domain-containing protein [Gymnopilus junonius]|uniref:Replication factor C subunit 1 n=1 Tax=Gymnopilus junonius TaxID=109634 RepID=A0A9P5NPX4_GYMJU|nr:replication factor RFC1 C terminal domain-containing protein [Gymnopilus junonius]